jgi:hypothetical protein
MVGVDPSTGNDSQIFGIDVMDQGALDLALGPDDLPGKDMLGLYERMMDVTALPETAPGRTGDTDVESEGGINEAVEISALALYSANGSNEGRPKRAVLFQARRYNALVKIGNEQGLLNMADEVHGAYLRNEKAQMKQVQSFMFRRGYTTEAISWYVSYGALPRLIERTADHYKQLLVVIVSAARQYRDRKWESSYANTMLAHHGKHLGYIREGSETYRDLILGSYIYLRDAASKKFQDESFNQVLWRRVDQSIPHDEETDTDLSLSKQPKPQCSHCRHRILHTGGALNCPLKDFKAKHAKALLQNVTVRTTARLLVKSLKEVVTHTETDTEIEAAIEQARTDHIK